MKTLKKIFIPIAAFFIFSTCFSGCMEQKYKAEKDKFVGTWEAEESSFRMYKFLENGTCYINDYGLAGTYEVNETEKIIIIHQKTPSKTYTYEYSFNYAHDRLTLSNEETGDRYVFNKK